MTAPVHFPSDREGLTWCGLPFASPTEQRDALAGLDRNGLRYSTDLAEVTCPGCNTETPTYPEPAAEEPAEVTLARRASPCSGANMNRCKRGCTDLDAVRCWPRGTVRTGRPCSCACHPVPVTLTPSEVAVARILAAQQEWVADEGCVEETRGVVRDAFRTMMRITGDLASEWLAPGGISAKGRDLLARARKAGVL